MDFAKDCSSYKSNANGGEQVGNSEQQAGSSGQQVGNSGGQVGNSGGHVGNTGNDGEQVQNADVSFTLNLYYVFLSYVSCSRFQLGSYLTVFKGIQYITTEKLHFLTMATGFLKIRQNFSNNFEIILKVCFKNLYTKF